MKRLLPRHWYHLSLLSLLTFVLLGCGAVNGSGSTTSSGEKVTVHLGYFPNVTHAVALVGVSRGTFGKALGSNVTLSTKTFNAGPSLIEALFAHSIDIGYVGPNPAINGYIKSHGTALRIIAGAASGGALFVVRPEANIKAPGDLANKKFATPQLGGTQDIALRYYIQQHGLKTADKGGNVQIVPTDNANILSLFKQGKIDGAWVPEPWATRLVVEGKGTIFVDERTLWPNGHFVTTNVVVSTDFYNQHPDLVKKFLQAHVDSVTYIQQNQDSARTIVNDAIKQATGQNSLPANELKQAFSDLDITYDPLAPTLNEAANRAYTLGFLGKSKPDLGNIYNLTDLNTILSAKGLPLVAKS
ncbi:MAG: ABC transporter substrate-binding protein [Ktedonobacteraceae bacterium]|nr:ABC transporter substrate-binding protein [Ktedonobacteraceae bacterium]